MRPILTQKAGLQPKKFPENAAIIEDPKPSSLPLLPSPSLAAAGRPETLTRVIGSPGRKILHSALILATFT
jgi:hypothetical protein